MFQTNLTERIVEMDFISGVSLQHLSKELKYNYYDCYTQHDENFQMMDGHAKTIMKFFAEHIIPGKIIEAG